MPCAIGVRIAGESLSAAAVEDNRVVGAIGYYPREGDLPLAETTNESFGELLRQEIEQAAGGAEIAAIGVGAPGIIREGLIEECPNLQQLKGMPLGALLGAAFPSSSILVLND